MTTPQGRLETDVKAAMKARDNARLSTLRLLLAAVKNRRIELGRELDDPELVGLVRKAIKQRHEAAAQFRQGGRPELADREEHEIVFLEPYLPAAPSEDEIRAAVAELIADQGLAGPQAMGTVMKAMLAKFAGAADGAQISKIAKELLGA